MVVFVILHYMALEETIACVESILNNIEGEKKIVVVDNASPNGSIDGLRKKYDVNPDVDVVETGENLGFAKGNNFGYRFAVDKYSPEFIVVMNNDMEITQKEFISGIFKSYEDYQYFIMGPDVYSTKKKYHQNPQTRPKPTEEEVRIKHRSYWIKDKLKFLFPVKWWVVDHFKKQKTDFHQYDKRPFVQEVVINPLLHGSCYVFSPLFIERHREECFYTKGYSVDVVDSTGAGDNFIAGFASEILNGKANEEALKFANACGAVSTTREGALAGLIGRTQIEGFMKEQL